MKKKKDKGLNKSDDASRMDIQKQKWKKWRKNIG